MRKLVPTADGSFTVWDEQRQSHFHSIHGAKSECNHVFINSSKFLELLTCGLPVSILEVGLGSGQNFFLVCENAQNYPDVPVRYTAYEPEPLSIEQLQVIHNQATFPNSWLAALQTESGKIATVEYHFNWRTWPPEVADFQQYDLIFYHTFGPHTQPELWTPESLKFAYDALKPGGQFLSFSINGNTRRFIRAQGWTFETPKGFASKRQMLKITKLV